SLAISSAIHLPLSTQTLPLKASSTPTSDTGLLAVVCCERPSSGRRIADHARRLTLGPPVSPARGCAIQRVDVATDEIPLHAPGEGRACGLSLYTWRRGEAELVTDQCPLRQRRVAPVALQRAFDLLKLLVKEQSVRLRVARLRLLPDPSARDLRGLDPIVN